MQCFFERLETGELRLFFLSGEKTVNKEQKEVLRKIQAV